jgi:hypothetical protein
VIRRNHARVMYDTSNLKIEYPSNSLYSLST